MRNIVFRASLCAIVIVGVSGLSAQAWAAPFTVTIQSPSAAQLVGDTLTISASSDSLYAITSGTASIANGTQTSGVAAGSQWSGTVSLLGAPRGARMLTVTLTDSSGAMASNSVAVTLDRPPNVVVNQPLAWAPVHSPFAIHATCTDDDAGGCAHLRFSGNGFVGVESKDQLDASVPFSMVDAAVTLKFVGEDSAGQTTEVNVPIYALSSPYLRFVGQGLSGSALDFDGNRILLTNNGKVWIHLISSGADTTVYDDANTVTNSASLTVNGAVLLAQPAPGQPVGPAHVLKWDGAQITDLNASYFQTNGTQLALQKSSSLELRDVVSGNLITSVSGSLGALGHPDRLVYYTFQPANYAVRFLHGATDTPLPGSYFRSPYLSAGDSFAVVTPQGNVNGPATLFPVAGGSEVLCPTTPNYCIFQVSGDYVAYQELTGNAPPVNLRTPAGERHPISAFAGATTLEAINSSGDVMMSTGGHRFLAKNSEAPIDLGGALGSVRAFDADWYLLADRTVFKYDFGAPAGGAGAGGSANSGGGAGSGTGGATAAGGSNSVGGALGTGGASTGGTTTVGGAANVGGAVASGGASTGGMPTGGSATSSGGSRSSGGQAPNSTPSSGGGSGGSATNGGTSGCLIAATPSFPQHRGWALLAAGLMFGTRLRRRSRPTQADL